MFFFFFRKMRSALIFYQGVVFLSRPPRAAQPSNTDNQKPTGIGEVEQVLVWLWFGCFCSLGFLVRGLRSVRYCSTGSARAAPCRTGMGTRRIGLVPTAGSPPHRLHQGYTRSRSAHERRQLHMCMRGVTLGGWLTTAHPCSVVFYHVRRGPCWPWGRLWGVTAYCRPHPMRRVFMTGRPREWRDPALGSGDFFAISSSSSLVSSLWGNKLWADYILIHLHYYVFVHSFFITVVVLGHLFVGMMSVFKLTQVWVIPMNVQLQQAERVGLHGVGAPEVTD